MELHEFANLIHDGASPDRSAFLSAYFTLVGTHGLHVTCGLLWLADHDAPDGSRSASMAWCAAASLASVCSGISWI